MYYIHLKRGLYTVFLSIFFKIKTDRFVGALGHTVEPKKVTTYNLIRGSTYIEGAIYNKKTETVNSFGYYAVISDLKFMYVALSYDHRIIDGSESVSFLVAVKDALENPIKILMNDNPEKSLEL